jgi:large subunit ribosomal protein L29
MKVKQIRDLSDEELMQKVKDLKGELFNLRFQAATGQLDNPMRIRDVRKTIARIKTVLTQRENEKIKLGSAESK